MKLLKKKIIETNGFVILMIFIRIFFLSLKGQVNLLKRSQELPLAEKIISLYENIRDDERGFIELKELIQKCHNLTKDEKRDVLSHESPDCSKRSNLVLLFNNEPLLK